MKEQKTDDKLVQQIYTIYLQVWNWNETTFSTISAVESEMIRQPPENYVRT